MFTVLHGTILALHIAGAAVITVSSLASLVILINKRVSENILALLKPLWKLVGPAMNVQVITGAALGALEWDTFGKNPVFWIKLALFIAAGGIGRSILGNAVRSAYERKSHRTPGAAAWAWVHVFLIIAMIVLGILLTAVNK